MLYIGKMKIRKANEKDKEKALGIAKELKEWFTPEAIKNMKVDFSLNNLIVALEGNKIIGFLCYSTNSGKMQIVWIGVARNQQRKGVGRELLNWIEEKAKELDMHSIEAETLPDEDDYKPYKQTREFYYKNGFKRVEYRKARIKGWDDQILLEKSIAK
jgi:N-acetylglutamate synthase-like GNAT family acetyltransferase